jgi:hypothetical protein
LFEEEGDEDEEDDDERGDEGELVQPAISCKKHKKTQNNTGKKDTFFIPISSA